MSETNQQQDELPAYLKDEPPAGQRAIRGTFRGGFREYLSLATIYYKKGRCKVPGCAGTPKVMCKNCNIHHYVTAEKKCFLKFRTE